MKTSKQYSVLIVGIMRLLCLFFLSFLCPSHVFSAAPTAAYLQTISGNLYAPGRIAVDSNGNIYVADPRQDRVQVYASDGYSKYTVTNFQGTPLGVALDGSNNLYISDARSKSVMVFDSNWNFIRKLGSGDNEFTLPGDIAISNSAGKVYVTDSQNNIVKVYNTGSGSLVTTFGGYSPTVAGMFNFPTGITVDDTNSEVIVVDEGTTSTGRLQRFQLDGAYKAGSSFSIKPFPQGITVDASGRIYVADTYEGSVYVYDTAGTQLSTIGSFGTSGGQLSNPMDVVFDNYGNLLITSSNNARVVMYSIDGSPPPPPCDTTRPTTEHSVSASVGQNGWYKSDIRIGLSASDSGENCPGGVSKIEYSFNAAAWSEFTSLIDVTTEGMIPFYYRATDVSGNVESIKSTTLKIDKTPPTIDASISPPQNANGWNNTDVTVSFTATDNASGVAIQPSPPSESLTSEGTFPLTRTATDNAGNTTTNYYLVKIDKTLPTITASVSPPANANGWNNTDITISFSGSDSLSGLAEISQTMTLTQDGISALIGQAKDFADNIASVNVPYKIDKTGPSITISSPSDNAVTKDNVTLNYTVTDSLAGVQSTEGDANGTTYTQEGQYTKTIKATDNLGNKSEKSVTFTIDKTPPTFTINSPADNTITNKDVTLEYTVTDNLTNTKVVDETGATVSSGATVYKDEKIYTKTYTATDDAGNKSAEKSVTFTIDKSVPTINITSPANNTITKDDVTLEYTVEPADATIEGDKSGTVYSKEDKYTKTIKAKDKAENEAQTSVTWTIDKTPPTITITSPVDNAVSGASIKLEYTVQDNLTETSKIKIEGDASGTVYTQERTYIKTIKATDEAGWTTTKTVTFTFIPNTGITVKTSEVYAYEKPEAKKPEEAEAKKEEVKEKEGTASITIISPKHGLLTKDDVILEYTVEGAEKIEGDASGTVYTKEDKYTKTITAIDKDGGRTTKKITFTIDKTPPEAEISYDIYNMDIKVSGTDNITKDVIITKSETGFSWTLTDEAGNTLIIMFEKIDKGHDFLNASIGILIYNGIGIIPNDNSMDIKIALDAKANNIKKITQTYRSKNMWKIAADYDKKKNTTKITTGDDKDIKAKDKKKDKTASSSGMKIIKFKTKAGELSYDY